ncbi:iron ABC transporter permease [Nisaea acidiphila]|uniref:Iron ABC transporter permease n=1 Tax=Nisaea acidiphila TaxID=1862145 RepID=A0A9J7APX9_9PROT|nr:iron ABC transporter permease [Nisaea acidiphila]UUX49279.1 iron ABC transporter permease [Nisaea acidiphila]
MKRSIATDGRKVLRLQSGLEIRLDTLWATGLLCAAALGFSALAISVGATRTGLQDFIALLTGAKLDEGQLFALLDVRLPRLVLGFMAGWCVALTGAMLQSMSQNPLADPGLLGLSQGSMVTILLLMVFAPAAPIGLVPVAAILGGLGVAALLLWLTGGGQSDGLAIVLMGIAVETVLSSVTSIMILYLPPETSFAVSDWLAGSLFQASWDVIGALAPWFALSLPAILLLGRALRCYDLGEETAMSLGEPVRRTKPVILFTSVLLTSAAVTAVGPLAFLGVMAPHLANALCPSSGRARLVLSGLTGGVLVIGADALTRRFAGDLAIPIGLALTLLGVPLFVISMRLRAVLTQQRT